MSEAEPAPEPEPSNEPSRRQLGLVVAGLVAALMVTLIATGDARDPFRHFLASLLLCICAYPAWHYFSRRLRSIPYLPAVSLIYFLSYGFPAFSEVIRCRSYRPDNATVISTLTLVIAGEVLLLLTFYLLPLPKLPQLKLELDLKPRAMVLIVVGVMGSAVRAAFANIDPPETYHQLIWFVSFLPLVMLSGLLLLWLRGQLAPLHSLLASVLLAATLILDVTTGFMAFAALTVGNLMFVYVAERHRLPLRTLLVVAVLIIPMLGVKAQFRHMAERQGLTGTQDRLGLFAELLGSVFTGGKKIEDVDQVARSRVDHLSSFAYVITKTPSVVPYWEGETYTTFLWSFVPRILVPDKPSKSLGQAYGHRYGFLSPHDYRTSMNLEQTVEMYANFGSIGVIVGMMLLGLVYRLLYEVLNRPGGGDGSILIAAAIFRVLLNIESDFSLVFGGVVQTVVLLYIALWLIAHRRGPAAEPLAT
jgi:hypothetical protein